MTFRLFGMAACLVGALGCESTAFLPSQPDPALITATDRVCTVAADCVIVQAACCPCVSNGQNAGNTAVASDALAAIEARRSGCSGVCSAAVSSSETCCADGVDCVDGRCELTGPAGLRLGEDDECVDRAER